MDTTEFLDKLKSLQNFSAKYEYRELKRIRLISRTGKYFCPLSAIYLAETGLIPLGSWNAKQFSKLLDMSETLAADIISASDIKEESQPFSRLNTLRSKIQSALELAP